MCHDIILQDGALIISDAHYSSNYRPELKKLLLDILHKKIITNQIIFMGDIFDALFGNITYTVKHNQEIIDLIQDISKSVDIVYLEGNHDFCLDKIFNNIHLFPIKLQPVICKYKDKTVILAHGDFHEKLLYKIYTFFIRNKTVLLLLKYIDILGKHFLLKKLDIYLRKKNDCQKFENFKDYVKRRLYKQYFTGCDVFIEGHFHQDVRYIFDKTLYINLPAFACNQRYFVISSHLMEK